jgi:hypothetical protein
LPGCDRPWSSRLAIAGTRGDDKRTDYCDKRDGISTHDCLAIGEERIAPTLGVWVEGCRDGWQRSKLNSNAISCDHERVVSIYPSAPIGARKAVCCRGAKSGALNLFQAAIGSYAYRP